MPIDLDEFRRLKKNLDTMQRDYDQAKGATDQLRKQLKDEFNCATDKEAKKLLVELEKEEQQLEEEFNEEMAGLKIKYPQVLEK